MAHRSYPGWLLCITAVAATLWSPCTRMAAGRASRDPLDRKLLQLAAAEQAKDLERRFLPTAGDMKKPERWRLPWQLPKNQGTTFSRCT